MPTSENGMATIDERREEAAEPADQEHIDQHEAGGEGALRS